MITILGPGCYSCNKLEQDVMAVLSETGMQAGLNHVSDPNLMAQYRNPSHASAYYQWKGEICGESAWQVDDQEVAGGGEEDEHKDMSC